MRREDDQATRDTTASATAKSLEAQADARGKARDPEIARRAQKQLRALARRYGGRIVDGGKRT